MFATKESYEMDKRNKEKSSHSQEQYVNYGRRATDNPQSTQQHINKSFASYPNCQEHSNRIREIEENIKSCASEIRDTVKDIKSVSNGITNTVDSHRDEINGYANRIGDLEHLAHGMKVQRDFLLVLFGAFASIMFFVVFDYYSNKEIVLKKLEAISRELNIEKKEDKDDKKDK